ncbi:defective pharyngeal development protein 4-like [Cimex lectularius]|uniref:Fork-head domain-containing protein n=1 Tax=Cimex lectularius TaxID=79782 RepID=A0A8I6TCW5_CIMLE|nr:defective pharyngeal development protein 4-like [Cimex lectularius]
MHELVPAMENGLRKKRKTENAGLVKDFVQRIDMVALSGNDLFNGYSQKAESIKITPKDQTVKNEEEPASLSWLVNLSAASLFRNTTDPLPLREYDGRLEYVDTSQNAKPGLTYTELIEKALKEKGELTVSEIYKWIYSNYPYYKKHDGRWKNSIRHNLSINPQFRKGERCNNGGHFWTLNKEYDDQFKRWQEQKKGSREERKRKIIQKREEEELELATRSIMLDNNSNESANFSTNNDPTLVRVATDILNGIDRQVEVEYMVKDESASVCIRSCYPKYRWLIYGLADYHLASMSACSLP